MPSWCWRPSPASVVRPAVPPWSLHALLQRLPFLLSIQHNLFQGSEDAAPISLMLARRRQFPEPIMLILPKVAFDVLVFLTPEFPCICCRGRFIFHARAIYSNCSFAVPIQQAICRTRAEKKRSVCPSNYGLFLFEGRREGLEKAGIFDGDFYNCKKC